MSVDDLVNAAAVGNIGEVTRLLNSGVDINGINSSGYFTALRYASANGREDVVRLLLSRGANVNLVTPQNRWTALMYACQQGHLSIVEMLLRGGADHSLQYKSGSTALMEACGGGHLSIVETLLRSGADHSLQSTDGSTALMMACGGGHLSVVELLLRSGAEHSFQNKYGDTALHWACVRGRTTVAELLLRHGATHTCRNQKGQTPVEMCKDSAKRAQLQAVIDSLEASALSSPASVAAPALPSSPAHTIPPPPSATVSASTSSSSSSSSSSTNAATLEQLRAQVASLTSERNSLQELLTSTLAEQEQLNRECTTKTGELRECAGQRDAVVAQRDRAIRERDQFSTQLTATARERETLSTQNVQLTAQLTASSRERDSLNTQNIQLSARLTATTREKDNLNARITQLSGELTASIRDRDGLSAQVAQLTAQLTQQTTERNAANTQRDTAVTQLATRTAERDQIARERDALHLQLDRETTRRRNAEAALHRALYTNDMCNFVSSTEPIMHLHRCCDGVADVTVTEAIFGGGRNGNVDGETCLITAILENDVGCTRSDVEVLLEGLRDTVTELPARRALSVEHALAIQLYTFGSDLMKPYAALNKVFYDRDRTIAAMRRQLPLTKLLIQSLRALGNLNGFVEDKVVYRSVSRTSSAYLQDVYANYNTPQNTLNVGNLLRFPTFTSTTSSYDVLRRQFPVFGSDIIYEIRLCRGHCVGVDVSHLSYFEREAEVLLIPPVSMRVTRLRMEGTSLFITLETQANNLTYLSN